MIINDKNNLKKLPTSQLVFYMVNPDLEDEKSKSKVEVTLYKRLTKKYKLCPDMVKDFIERESQVVKERGNDLTKYTFGENKNLTELFTIFYDSIELSGKLNDLLVEIKSNKSNFNTLTMSEMVEFLTYFSYYEDVYKKRMKILEDVRGPFGNQEKSMLEYNKFLNECLLNKLKEIMGYAYNDNQRVKLTVAKESLLLLNSPLQKPEMEYYDDIFFDAYSYDKRLIANILEKNVDDVGSLFFEISDCNSVAEYLSYTKTNIKK